MRIILRAMLMLMGVMLVVSAVGLGALNLVLDACPTCTAPTTAEDIATYRKLVEDTQTEVSPDQHKTSKFPDNHRA